jgi:S1-C subfamily serine protease
MLRLVSPCNGTRISSLALSNPSVASVVYAIGCPGGLCGRVTKGIVSAYEQPAISDRQSGLRLISDVKIWFGNSGGGLFDDDGSLLGICSAVQHMGVPINPITDPTGDASEDWSVFIPPHVIREWALNHGVYL